MKLCDELARDILPCVKPRILVVDDEPEAVELVEFNLKQAGYAVTTAADGAEALKKARAQTPDLIVLDVMPPKWSGGDRRKKLEDGALEIFVRDDGPGIPPESIDRVFERFYRVDKARSRDQGGTGLGLSTVKHIVHAHGGKVWAESEPGRGATFFFTLPPGTKDPVAD